jgi:hypothetical protein
MPDPTVIAVIATIVLSLGGVAYLLWGWLTRRSWRALVRGAGLTLGAIGMMISGFMELAVNGVESLIRWHGWTEPGVALQVGLWTLGIGVVAFVIGSFIAPVQKGEAGPAVESGKPGKAPLSGSDKRVLNPASPAPKPGKPAAKAPALSSEDAEIDEILKRHGF